jgi:hypothetical protein
MDHIAQAARNYIGLFDPALLEPVTSPLASDDADYSSLRPTATGMIRTLDLSVEMLLRWRLCRSTEIRQISERPSWTST